MQFWQHLGQALTEFFLHGLGGPGAQGIGTAIMVVGVVMAVISFVMHKFNQQSRLPGWFTCLLMGIAGSVLVGGLEKPIQAFTAIKDTFLSWMGL